jgi:hypothetical protein
MLIKAIVKKLKTGSIKNVIPFADSMKVPPPPYVVIKPESGAIPGTRQFRLIVHTEQGRLEALEKYVFTELSELLVTDREGQTVRLKDEEGKLYQLRSGDWFDVRPEETGDFKLICMERLFYVPWRIC